MAKWYVKDLSKLTGVSVQTLHHYDRIELLKPSLRLSNGYRVYSERDLLRLQQIIALKFLGFELAQIKELLAGKASAFEHFSIQAKLLEQKAMHLLDASNALKKINAEFVAGQSIPWETIIQLIEVYQMSQKLEYAWVKEIFSPEELKQYIDFETEMKANAPEKQEQIEQGWINLKAEMQRHIHEDPNSAIGITIGKKCMDWVNSVYGRKHANLRTKKFEQGFAQGKGLNEVGLTPELVTWMDKAMDAYWQDRIYGILNQVGTGVSNERLCELWQELLDDMYGEDRARKNEVYEAALADAKVSVKAKEWLKVWQI